VEFKKLLTELGARISAQLDVHLICDKFVTHKSGTVTKWRAALPCFHMHPIPTYSSGSIKVALLADKSCTADRQDDLSPATVMGPV
jgi:hypothetical protein